MNDGSANGARAGDGERVQHVFFDLDGTLTDPAPGIVACMIHAARQLGRKSFSERDARQQIGPPLRESFAIILETDDTALIEEGVRLYRQRFGTVGLFENSVYPGIVEMLDSLTDQGYRLCVVTSKPTQYADQIVDHFELRGFLPTVYGSEMSGERSDKGELVAHALQSEGIEASRTCMIGDRKHDIVGARRHRVPTIGVTWGYGSAQELEEAGADRVVGCVEELQPVIMAMHKAANGQ